jgi:uncharacterized protein (DUF58 family)
LLAGEMIVTLMLLLAFSVAMREAPLFLLTLSLLVAAALSRLWERYALERVEYRRRFSRACAGFGELVELEIEVVNRKLLPLSWLEAEDEIPAELELQHSRVHPSHKPGRAILAILLAMRPYERLRRRYTISCAARGEHIFGPVRLRSGDLFGFATCDRTLETCDTIVVFPRVVPLHDLGLPARHPLGDLRTQSWIFEDPSRIAGVREYRPGDSLRRVHWPATARSQQLQTRAYDATTGHKLGIFLNLSTFEDEQRSYGYGYDPDVLELSITAAASIASWGFEQGYQVGLYTNGLHRGSLGSVTVEPGRSVEQMERILWALGRLQPQVGERFEDLLARHGRQLPFGTTAVVVSAALTAEAASAIRGLRASGHGIAIVVTGRSPAAVAVDGIPVRRVGPPEDWREMAVLVGATP